MHIDTYIASMVDSYNMYISHCRIPDTEALSFSMDFTSTNTTVLGKPVMVPLTEGIIYEDTGKTFYSYSPLFPLATSHSFLFVVQMCTCSYLVLCQELYNI